MATFSTVNWNNAQSAIWEGLTTNDYGTPWKRSDFSDKTYQVLGDFGTNATVTFYGSNVQNPVLTTDTDWFILTDTTETALSITSAGGGQILQNPLWIRPKVTSGTLPDLDVLIEAVRK